MIKILKVCIVFFLLFNCGQSEKIDPLNIFRLDDFLKIRKNMTLDEVFQVIKIQPKKTPSNESCFYFCKFVSDNVLICCIDNRVVYVKHNGKYIGEFLVAKNSFALDDFKKIKKGMDQCQVLKILKEGPLSTTGSGFISDHYLLADGRTVIINYGAMLVSSVFIQDKL